MMTPIVPKGTRLAAMSGRVDCTSRGSPRARCNCSLWVSMDVSSLIALDKLGSFKTSLPVPASTSILGAEMYSRPGHRTPSPTC